MFKFFKRENKKEKALNNKDTMLEFVDILLLNEKQLKNKGEKLYIKVCDDIYGAVVLNFRNSFICLNPNDIEKLGINKDEVVEQAIKNNLKNIKIKNQELGFKENKEDKVYMLNDGDVTLYSSLIINEDFRKKLENKVFCFPSRYMLVFTDIENDKGKKELLNLCNIKVGEDITEDEFVSSKLFIIADNKIVEYNE